ncbi:uncharacterized protein LOC121738752 [Aricia agestis]|uniref:uncharacterized protein LOC121738752 n=1 Tax=Aricia agestis TaxID=91739 RepID=UPI001C204F33|nr:uncharacterized protein LOC121738752 [Aricia agestis]
MSTRNLRKMVGGPALPPPESGSDDEYEPTYVKNSFKSNYDGLLLSSSSESECQEKSNDDKDESEEELQPKLQPTKKKNNRKRKKSRKLSINNKDTFDMDEIDKSLLEVNALLGEPTYKPPSSPQIDKAEDVANKLFGVQFKHLNASNELTRLFGPDEEDEANRRRGRQQNLRRVQRGSFIPKEYSFHAKGLSMSMNRKDKDYTYFTFDHSRDYQNMHKTFLSMMVQGLSDLMQPTGEALRNMHVEELIEIADVLFRVEEYSQATELIETSIAYMLHSTSPFFNITNRKTRLEYKFVENRPFHILLLKYIYLLTNKACHRTALEVAKLLMNLDPSDPLGVQLIIDTLALRAREHQWLIDTINHLTIKKNAAYMFNMRYSYALAYFHVLTKKKEDLKVADNILKSAILRFPSFVKNLLDAAKQKPSPILQNSLLYTAYATATTSKSLKETINLYAHFTCTKWREQPVMQWFLRNAEEISIKFDEDSKTKARATIFANVRNTLFMGWPEEIIRHFSVVQPMSNFVVDGAVPKIPQTFSFNPAPPKNTVDRYGYTKFSHHAVDSNSPFIVRFFSTIFPGYNLFRPNNGYDMQRLHETFYDENAAPPAQETQEYQEPPPTLMDDMSSDEDANTLEDRATNEDNTQHVFNVIEEPEVLEELNRQSMRRHDLQVKLKMYQTSYSRTAVFCIIAAEFCERFSFCGLRTILSLYLRNVLCLHENSATVVYHIFIMMCYTLPLVGAILADNFLGRYRVIVYFSVIYLIGAILTCFATIPPLTLPPMATSLVGLALIAAGTGAIKPCVAAFGGDQFHLPRENQSLQRFFTIFYCTVNLGGFVGMVVTPAVRRSFMCFGDDTCYALGFGLPALLVFISICIFVAGKPWYRIKKPRDNVTMKFVLCTLYSLKGRFRCDRGLDGIPRAHWLDYSRDKYGEKLVADMKVVFSILYLFLPVPIFWSLFDQQGSRWTFQASRLTSEVFGITLMPDQLQVLNPALVLLMMPVCPGGAWSILPEMDPLKKMFVGGILTSLAFVSAGILQIAIERSTLQTPRSEETGLVILNTLPCAVELAVCGGGIASIKPSSTFLMTSLPHREYAMAVSCSSDCDGRVMMRRVITTHLKTAPGMFMPIIVGQNSDDELSLYYMDPSTLTKSLTGKPKMKVVYVGKTGPNRNVSISVKSDKRISDVYYVSDSSPDDVSESAFMCMQPGKFKWRAESTTGSWAGEGHLRCGGVYILCLRERSGVLDAAVLHAPNPPNELHLVWIIPQYILISIAEIMFAISGLEFSFMQAPKSMKTITIAAWYVSVAFGNLIVILVTQSKVFQNRATEFFVYAATLTIAMLVFLKMTKGFCSRTMEGDGSSTESHPLLNRHSTATSLRSTSSILYFGTDNLSCLGLTDEATTWPTQALVHIGTPSTSEAHFTSLAKE